MLSIKLKRPFLNEKNKELKRLGLPFKMTFLYGVSGSAKELEQYKESQGLYYSEDEDTGEPLYFTTQPVGNTGTLIFTSKGTAIADSSGLDMANALATNYSGVLGQEIARQAVAQLLSGAFTSRSQPISNVNAGGTTNSPSVDEMTEQEKEEQAKRDLEENGTKQEESDTVNATAEDENVELPGLGG